jgi:hypothetical protein
MALDLFQDTTQRGFRQTWTRPTVIVAEHVRVRVFDFHLGVTLHAKRERRISPYAGVLIGPALVTQAEGEAAFVDVFLPPPQHEWKPSLEIGGGLELRGGRFAVGLEVAWREIFGEVVLSQLREERPLDSWTARLRFRVRL